MKVFLIIALTGGIGFLTQFEVFAQVKTAMTPKMTTTDLTLLVNAGTLGSQPTQSQKNAGSYNYSSETMTSPGASLANNPQKNANEFGSTSVGNVIGAQAGYVKTKPGKYGIAFDANVVKDLYKKRILDNLDNFIEAASINLNPSSNSVTELLLSKLLTEAGQKEQAAGYPAQDLALKYAAFVNSFRQQLANVDYVKIMQSDPITYFTDITNKAGTAQCISFCDTPFLNYMTVPGGSKTTAASVSAAFYVAYLLSYDNVWKQNDATYKALYDNYVTRKQGNKMGTYQFATNRHGASVSFKRYGVQFGLFSGLIAGSGNAQASTWLWDTECNCPDSALFSDWSSTTQSSFIIP